MAIWTPDRFVTGVEVIDLRQLLSAGKRALLIDRDNTIVPRDTSQVTPVAREWIASAHALGFKVCIVSNNHWPNVTPDAEALGCELICEAKKPLPFAIWRACEKLGVERCEAVMIGDQLLTDSLGGRLAGITTVLVMPQCDVDLPYARRFRKVERRFFPECQADSTWRAL